MSRFSRRRVPGSGSESGCFLSSPSPRLGLLGALLRRLGLSRETRVHVSIDGLDVVLRGDADRVRYMLGVITAALHDAASPSDEGPRGVEDTRIGAGTNRPSVRAARLSSDQVLVPSDLDESDAPYALPEAESLALTAPHRPYYRTAPQARWRGDKTQVAFEEATPVEAEWSETLGYPRPEPTVPRAPSLSMEPFDDVTAPPEMGCSGQTSLAEATEVKDLGLTRGDTDGGDLRRKSGDES